MYTRDVAMMMALLILFPVFTNCTTTRTVTWTDNRHNNPDFRLERFSRDSMADASEKKRTDKQPVDSEPLPAWIDKSAGEISGQQVLLVTKIIEITTEGNADTSVTPSQQKLTDPQMQVFIRKLAQKKEADLMSSPSVVTRSGQKAKVEIIREFIYPTNPEGKKFELENVGVTTHFLPVIGEDGKSIHLKSLTVISEFEGYAEVGPDFDLPVFERRRMGGETKLPSGHSIVYRGHFTEDEKIVEERGPVFGLLRKRTKVPISRELIVVVTPTLIDKTGAAVSMVSKKPDLGSRLQP